MTESKYYTTRDLSALLNQSKYWVEERRDNPAFPGACRIGRGWRFNKSVIDKLIASGRLSDILKRIPSSKKQRRAVA